MNYRQRMKAFHRRRLNRLREFQFADMELGNMVFGHSRGRFKVERGRREREFRKFLQSCGFDLLGNCIDRRDVRAIRRRGDFGYENETFILRPYYWGGNSRKMRRPNFVFKPTGYQLKWYKYPLRDSYANMNVTDEEFGSMLVKCIESVGSSQGLGVKGNPHGDMFDAIRLSMIASGADFDISQ